MKRNVNKITSLLCTWILLVAVITSVSNKILYTHVHQLSNGSWVLHAHPYNKTHDTKPIKTHAHSANELTFFHTYYHFLLAFFGMAAVVIAASKKIAIRYVLIEIEPMLRLGHQKGRSPPTASIQAV